MTLAVLTLSLALSSAVDAPNPPTLSGTWTAKPTSKRILLHFELDSGRHNTTFTVQPRALKALADTRHVLVREAGTFQLDGPFDGKTGQGTFTFTPDLDYGESLARFGYTELSTHRYLELALVDLRLEFIAGLKDLGYETSLKRVVEMKIHGAGPDYIRDLASVGYTNLPPKRLVEMRIHDVNVSDIRAFKALGYEALSAQQLVQMQIHDVTPERTRRWTERLGRPTAQQLIQMQIHDVTPDFVEQMAQAGYPELTVRQLVQMQIHDVTPRFVQDMKSAGYTALTARQLIQMQIHDVTPEWARRQTDDSGQPLSARALIQRRIHD